MLSSQEVSKDPVAPALSGLDPDPADTFLSFLHTPPPKGWVPVPGLSIPSPAPGELTPLSSCTLRTTGEHPGEQGWVCHWLGL